MVRKARGLLVVALLLTLGELHPNAASAQAGPATAQVVLGLPPGPISVSNLPPPPPVSGLLPSPEPGQPGGISFEDCNGPLLRGDPLLDRPEFPLPGWLLAVETGAMVPHIKNRLTAQVPVAGDLVTVHVPTGDLDWTGPIRVELGYRFPEGFGEVLLSYRSLVSDGFGWMANFDALGDSAWRRSRLNLNEVALDYASREYSLGPCWDMKWKAGVRLASVFFDARAVAPVLARRNSNDYLGAGPELGLDLWRRLGLSGWAWFGRLEGAALLGKIKQGFNEEVIRDGTLVGGAQTIRGNQGVPVLTVQTGLSWTPPRYTRLRLSTGYEYEMWWYIGQAADSAAELTDQGVFFRAELNF